MVEKSRVNAFKDHFGKKVGQTLTEFAAEIKEAWQADPQGWINLFASVDVKVTDVKTV
jgi:hypothetical protein